MLLFGNKNIIPLTESVLATAGDELLIWQNIPD